MTEKKHFNTKSHFHDIEIGSLVRFERVDSASCHECVADLSKAVCGKVVKYLGHSINGCEFEFVEEPFECPHCGHITKYITQNCRV